MPRSRIPTPEAGKCATCTADPPAADAIEGAAAERRVPLTVVDIDNEAAHALYARRLVLVRPDGHVAWRADRGPDDARALIDTIRGAA